MISKRCLLALAASMFLGGAAMAESINVPNYSFESPSISTNPGWTLTMDNWSKGGYSDGAGILKNGYLGYTVTNVDGTQMGFMSTVSHTITSFIYQVLSAAYVAGKSYTLTVGAAQCGATPFGDPESKLIISFYWNNGGTNMVIGSRQIRFGDLTTSALTDYSVTVPAVQFANAFAGSPIGIMIAAETNAGNNVYWDVDNVRLEATTVFTPITDTIAVSNYSFEVPVIGADPGFTYAVSNWIKGAGEPISGITRNPYGGYNITNLDGSQAGFVASQSTNDPALWGSVRQELSATYTVGRQYILTVGAAQLGAVAADAENKLAISFYWNNGGATNIISTQQVRFGDLGTTALTDYQVAVPMVQPSDSYAGKPIGILIATTPKVSQNVYWNVDNVRLISVRMPPPAGTIICVR